MICVTLYIIMFVSLKIQQSSLLIVELFQCCLYVKLAERSYHLDVPTLKLLVYLFILLCGGAREEKGVLVLLSY